MMNCPVCQGHGEVVCNACADKEERPVGNRDTDPHLCPACLNSRVISCSYCGGSGAIETAE